MDPPPPDRRVTDELKDYHAGYPFHRGEVAATRSGMPGGTDFPRFHRCRSGARRGDAEQPAEKRRGNGLKSVDLVQE